MAKPKAPSVAERIREASRAHFFEEIETLSLRPWQAAPVDVRDDPPPDWVTDKADWERARRQYREIIARNADHYRDLDPRYYRKSKK